MCVAANLWEDVFILSPEANAALAVLVERRGIGASALICKLLMQTRKRLGD